MADIQICTMQGIKNLVTKNIFYCLIIPLWQFKSTDPRPRREEDIVENGDANKETPLVKIEEVHNRQDAAWCLQTSSSDQLF